MTPPPARGRVHRVRFARSGAVLEVPDDVPVLQAGLEAGLQLKFGCTMGGCGACKVRLLSGDLELQQPNCLSPEDHRDGQRLLCVAWTIGDVEIDA